MAMHSMSNRDLLKICSKLYNDDFVEISKLRANLSWLWRLRSTTGKYYVLKSSGSKRSSLDNLRFVNTFQSFLSDYHQIRIPPVLRLTSGEGSRLTIDSHCVDVAGIDVFAIDGALHSFYQWIDGECVQLDPKGCHLVGGAVGSYLELTFGKLDLFKERCLESGIGLVYSKVSKRINRDSFFSYDLSQGHGEISEIFNDYVITLCLEVRDHFNERYVESFGNQENHCLLHGDLKPSNIVFDQISTPGIVDFDGCRIGNQHEDLAWAMLMTCARSGRFDLDFARQFLQGVRRNCSLRRFNARDLLLFMKYRCVVSSLWPFRMVREAIASDGSIMISRDLSIKIQHARMNTSILTHLCMNEEQITNFLSGFLEEV